VNHRPRQRGISKYGVFDRLGVGITDLLGVLWLRRRAARPVLVEDATPSAATASAELAATRQREPAL
jgi:hypothetical protein